LNARTGELTPPGIRVWAALKIAWERVVFKAGAEAGAEVKADPGGWEQNRCLS
jgi:hypothetical protein